MREPVRTVFKPHEKGLRKVFGDLEADVMELVWRRGQVTVSDVWEVLRKERDVAYTTVKTVMGRLAEKGYLKKRAEERAHSYVPRISREEFLRSVGEEVLGGLLEDFGEPIRVHLVEALKKHDRAGLELLERLIREEKRRRR